MKTIWKYPIHSIPGFNNIQVRRGSRVLSVGRQFDTNATLGNSLFLWCEVNDEETPRKEISVLVVLTGEFFESCQDYNYFTTVTLRDNPPFVVHVYIKERFL